MQTRFFLLLLVVLLGVAEGCRGKKKGPYLTPEPVQMR
jgi:hypothetical protein